jgi:hypothetical protein
MPISFPGMDPYLEAPGLWPDVHDELISSIRNQLNQRLPEHYHARTRERVYITDETDPGRQFLIPDVHVRVVGPPQVDLSPAATAVAAEPLTVTTIVEEEIQELLVEIVDLDDDSVVTVIEVLSPSNKLPSAHGHDSYHVKRRQVMRSPVSLVEIDLLRAGQRVPIVEKLPTCDYLVHVSRAWSRPQGTVWPIVLSQPLPANVAIPLRETETDAVLDLQAALVETCQRGRYERAIDYRRDPPPPPLADRQRAWLHSVLTAAGLR